MAQTNINIRMDEDLKRQFEAFCQDVGMSMTTAFTLFAKRVVREWEIPFNISGDPFAKMPGTITSQEELDAVITERIEEWEANREEYTAEDEADAVFATLHKKYFG